MLLKPDEVSNLKKGKQVYIEVAEGDVRVLRRNYCGVYELYEKNNPRNAEYFEDLNLFKNRYAGVKRKFPLYNISRQRLDIFAVAESINCKEVLKWFEEYGKINLEKSEKYEDIIIEYYTWISDMENTCSEFQIIKNSSDFTLNIPVKNNHAKNKVAV